MMMRNLEQRRTTVPLQGGLHALALGSLQGRYVSAEYVCEKCGHIAGPDKLDHICPCAKCADLQRKAG